MDGRQPSKRLGEGRVRPAFFVVRRSAGPADDSWTTDSVALRRLAPKFGKATVRLCAVVVLAFIGRI
jgi:hypothetical protein